MFFDVIIAYNARWFAADAKSTIMLFICDYNLFETTPYNSVQTYYI